MDILGSLDITRTLDRKTSAISGLIASAIPFSSNETIEKGDSQAHARLGVDKKIGRGVLSTSINILADKGSKPTLWANGSYNINF